MTVPAMRAGLGSSRSGPDRVLSSPATEGGKVTGSYQVDVDGARVAGGGAANTLGFRAKVSPKPSVIRFTLDAGASEPAVPDLLSDRSQMVWTWRSAHGAGAMLPRGWMCGKDLFGSGNPDPPRDCAVQPLLTLRYAVARMSLSGAVQPGAQLLHVQVSYRAAFTAPQGSKARFVTLRVTAADAAGSAITETIWRAYAIAR